NKDKAFMSKELATIYREAPIEVAITDTAFSGYDPAKLAPFFKELAFESLLDRLGLNTVPEQEHIDLDIEVTVIDTETDLSNEVLTSPAALHVEIIEDNYHAAPIHGFSIYNQHGLYFIPKDV